MIHLCVLSISSSPSLLRFGFNSTLLVRFVFGGDQPLNSWFDGLFVTILIPLALCYNHWNREFTRIGDFEFLRKTPILFDLSSISHDLLIFWVRSFGDMLMG